METIIYCLKVLVCSGVMYAYYLFFLKDKTFHHYNRFYLLLLVVVSLILPLLKVEYFTIELNDKVFLIFNKFQTFTEIKKSDDESKLLDYIPFLIFIIAAVLMTKILLGIMKINRLKSKFTPEKINGINFYQTDLHDAPFSFFKNLFWKDSIIIQSDLGKQILKHEMVHIEQKHSYDKIFIEIISSVFWFNPVFHIIKKEISLIHEYLADHKAVKKSDTKTFAEMLLASHFSGNILPGTSPFLNSNLKKRLKMIQKPKTKYAYARRFFALPIMFSVAFAYMVNAKNKEIEKQNEQIETIADFINNKEESLYSKDTLADNEITEYKTNDIFIFDGKKISQEDFLQKKNELENNNNYYFTANKNFLDKGLPVIYVGGKNKNVKKDDQFIGKIVAVVWDTPAAEKIKYDSKANDIPFEEQLKNADEKALYIINSDLVSKENFEKYYTQNKDKVAFSSSSHLMNDKDHWVFGEREQCGVFQVHDLSEMNEKNAEKFHQLVKKINPKWYYEQYINQKYTARENERKIQNGEKENIGKVSVEEVKVSSNKRDYDKEPLTQTEINELREDAKKLQAKVEKQSQIERANMIIFKADIIASYVTNKEVPPAKDYSNNTAIKTNNMVMPLVDGKFFIDGKEYSKEEIKNYMKGFEEDMFNKTTASSKAPFRSVKMYRTPYGDKGFSRLDKVEFFTK
ncbi:M56 family metallopeptidase [Chryseobacterium sp. CBo1]|uniref:M56 family metallopeptidase n=1 Tax=Chryseobacterium sp. CBo1 TaxID=1869230 RepID=UPI0009F1C7C2|nr:M56 family metallopeptidase [Chryseobacterium sp. CBo1]